MKDAKKEKRVIGWSEYIDFPEWGIKRLKVKIDTGARTSCLHVEDVKDLPGNRISFYVVLDKNKKRKKIIATPEKRGNVKSSTGRRTHRWYIETAIKIGDLDKRIKINLIDRAEMNFRMLIGRKAIEGHFLVDVSHKYLLKKKKKIKDG